MLTQMTPYKQYTICLLKEYISATENCDSDLAELDMKHLWPDMTAKCKFMQKFIKVCTFGHKLEKHSVIKLNYWYFMFLNKD